MRCARHCWTRAGIVVIVLCALATAAAGQPVQVRQLGQPGPSQPAYLAIPGLHQLGADYVQKDLELIDEQKDKLREIATRYREKQREVWGDLRNLPAEERQAKIAEIREQTSKLAEEARKEADGSSRGGGNLPGRKSV